MKNFSKIKYLLLFIVIAQSCKTINTSVSLKNQDLPHSFIGVNKSDTFRIPRWRDFIKDTLLINLLDSAIVNNQDINSAIQRIEIARAGFNQSKSALLPTGNFNMVSSLRKFGLYTMDGAGNITTEITPGKIVPIHLPDYYVGASSSWEVDMWGKLKAQKKQSFANYLQSKEAYNLVLSSVISDISVAYFQLISADSKLYFIDSMLIQMNHAIEVLEEQKLAGRINELAIQQFVAQVKEMEILKNDILLEIQKTENLINFLAGRFPKQIDRANHSSQNFINKISAMDLPSQLLNYRPDVKYAYYEVEKNKCQLIAARANFLPSFSINSNLGFQAFNFKYLVQSPTSIAYNLLGNLTAPLINRMAIKMEFNKAKASQIEAMYQYQKVIINAYTEVLNFLNTINNLNSNLKLREERVEALSNAMEASIELFKSSKASYFELLFIRQSEINAQWDLISNNFNLQIAEINLFRSLGGFIN